MNQTQRWVGAADRLIAERQAYLKRKVHRDTQLEARINRAARWLETFLSSEKGIAGLKVLEAVDAQITFAENGNLGGGSYRLTKEGCVNCTFRKDTKVSCREFVSAFYSRHQHNRSGRVRNSLLKTLRKIVISSIEEVALGRVTSCSIST